MTDPTYYVIFFRVYVERNDCNVSLYDSTTDVDQWLLENQERDYGDCGKVALQVVFYVRECSAAVAHAYRMTLNDPLAAT